MAEKRYCNDWAKAKSRDLVKSMIQRTLLKFRKPRDIKVLCFPGVDAEEIFQVYDPLGIPRGNIVGVEREPDIADILEEKKLGISVVRGNLEDYVRRQGSLGFDVVSLDYIGPIGVKQIDTITDIVQKQQRNHFVLHTANLMRRDRVGLRLQGRSLLLEDVAKQASGDFSWFPSTYKCDAEVAEHLISSVRTFENDDDRKAVREEGYSKLMSRTYSLASTASMTRIFKFAVGRQYHEMLDSLDERLSDAFGVDLHFDREDPYSTLSGSLASSFARHLLESTAFKIITVTCENQGLSEKAFQLGIWHMLCNGANEMKCFIDGDASCYTYISESGAPMIGDVRFLSYSTKAKELCKDICSLVGFPDNIDVRDSYKMNRIKELTLQYLSAVNKFSSPEDRKNADEAEKNRIFLGNSSKPVLTKRRAVEEFESGATVDDIKAKYRGWNNKPLAQWKAHVTMGTYNSQQTFENGSGETDCLTKDEALDLIESKIPIEEIYEAFPTSFSLPQLRAYKAHLTMGTYEKSDK